MMLGKTAGALYWMFRYIERAENTARLVEAGWYIALTHAGRGNTEWKSIITTAGADGLFETLYEEYSAANVINFLLRSPDNPSSVVSIMANARSAARTARTALSSEVWEATNECWMSVKQGLARPVNDNNLHDLLAMIRAGTSSVRGALHGTMLRNDIFSFTRLGTCVERADNTARILDVKYYVLLPSSAFVGSSMDNTQWEIILRSVSAERSFRWLYGGDASPREMAAFLILDRRMPRSLTYCYSQIGQYLGQLEQEYGSAAECHGLAAKIRQQVNDSTIDTIFRNGLHEFLRDFIADTGELSGMIERDYRFYR